MLDASRSNETAGVERISKLQEEKKILQVKNNSSEGPKTAFRSELPGSSVLSRSLMPKNESLNDMHSDLKRTSLCSKNLSQR